jgi:hypothetical protein
MKSIESTKTIVEPHFYPLVAAARSAAAVWVLPERRASLYLSGSGL